MAKQGPIILVEDDEDDKIMFEDIVNELEVDNQLMWFSNAQDAYQFLKTTQEQPFLIFSDVNLPKQSGLDLKKDIDSDPQLRRKSIPFIFYSTSVEQSFVNEAYINMTVQGFFQKPSKVSDMKHLLTIIVEYWKHCKHPNTI